ncbi:hypothetical protein [Actinoplanes utahensis]|uniref:Uncharacterized protein n=1 Tax=Actinoplanes utahensis TaxID=1869 RepID=A0A0A6UKF0_ACTUT|nr:hypothetical protein [Actinoplanes utahensis]KHD75911.1 hypothetical protein MB27_19870 [Actinoplanes utahensis]GIF35008.1 hypothetical protein Aut01nite_79940 [Actinoplanes utahensis]
MFIWSFVRRAVLTAVLVPLGVAGARRLSDTVERRRGPNNRASRLLRQGADTAQTLFGRKKKRRFGFL